MAVTITGVYDEGAMEDTPLIGAKGFSVLIDDDGRRVLVDTGLRGRYLKHNLENLDVDPESVEAVVVTQAHPDNSRGLDGFLDMRASAVKVYAPAGLYDSKCGLLGRSVGISDENRPKADIDVGEGWIEVTPSVTVTPYVGGERFVVVKGKRLTVISGRGASGPSAALEAVRDRFGRYPDAFVGSVLLEKAKKPVAEAYANDFLASGCGMLYLNHSTGRDGMVNLRVHLGLKGVEDFYVGSVFRS